MTRGNSSPARVASITMHGAVANLLREHRIERHQEVQPLAGVGIQHREERGVGAVEIGLIERDLRGIDLDRARSVRRARSRASPWPQGLMFPNRRINQAIDFWPSDQDSVGMTAE